MAHLLTLRAGLFRAGLLGTALMTLLACSSDDVASASAGSDGAGTDTSEPGEGPTLGGPVLGGDSLLGDGGSSASPGATCASVGVWGSPGVHSGGAPLNSDPLVDWLNDATTFDAQLVLRAPEDWDTALADHSLVILRDLRQWELDEEDARALRKWVEEGGAVMALSGFSGDGSDALLTNQLLSFSRMQFGTASLDTAVAIGPCGYCLGTTSQQGGFVSEHPIATGVERVGAYQGRSIDGDGNAVAALDGQTLGMTTTVGAGRVFFFHDEWIALANEWSDASAIDCSDNPECSAVGIERTYQIDQFWYNALRWLVPGAVCLDVNGADIFRW